MPDKDFNKSQMIYRGWQHPLLNNFVSQPSAVFAGGQYKHCQDEAGMGQESLTRAEEGVSKKAHNYIHALSYSAIGRKGQCLQEL